MSRLPVIVGFGGVNPAGRSSGLHGYRRMVFDSLSADTAAQTLRSLQALTGAESADDSLLANTLIRRLETNLFDPADIRINKTAKLAASPSGQISFTLRKAHLPEKLPDNWTVTAHEGPDVLVTTDNVDVLFPDAKVSRVNAAGQLPTGFNPEALYQSRNHPRGLQLTVYGASDAINSLGIPWDEVKKRVPGDQIAVYASSAMGQLDTNGSGGMLQAQLMGKRVSSKNCALGLAEMTADFVNAYILGSVGSTGANIGACATFLYNLRQGIEDIRSGKFRAVLVGSSEAPLTPEVMEGYRTMGALAEDEALKKIDGITDGDADHRRACRPFAENCGFTLAEASQFVVLFDDALALELGAEIYGGVADVFVNADGFKKSIPGPGIGNYVTVGKAMGVIRSILGEDTVRHRTYMHAHGTGTPQNRVTESHIFSAMAEAFGIEKWPVAAIKAYIGHSLACASGDQIIASLGTWQDGLIPGIKTIDAIAEDVHQDGLEFLMDHREVDPASIDASFINSKGFGGNNATAAILAPHVVRNMMEKRHGKDAMLAHDKANEGVREQIASYDEAMLRGENAVIYQFGEGVVEGGDLTLSSSHISIPGQALDIDLNVENPYPDMS